MTVLLSQAATSAPKPVQYQQVVIIGENHLEQVTALAHIEMLHQAGKGEIILLEEGFDVNAHMIPGFISERARIRYGLPPDFKIANTYGMDSDTFKAYGIIGMNLYALYKGDSQNKLTGPGSSELIVNVIAGLLNSKLLKVQNDPAFARLAEATNWQKIKKSTDMREFVAKYLALPADYRIHYLEMFYTQLAKTIDVKYHLPIARLKVGDGGELDNYLTKIYIPVRDMIMAKTIERFAKKSRVPVVAMMGAAHVAGVTNYLKRNHPAITDQTYVTDCATALTGLWE